MKNKNLMCLILSIALILSTGAPSYAVDEKNLDNINGKEIVDEIVENIIEAGDYTVDQENEIEEDVETLNELGIDIECIEIVRCTEQT